MNDKLNQMTTEAAVVAALAAQPERKPHILDVNGRQILMTPQGDRWDRADLPDSIYADAPPRQKGCERMGNVESLLRYVAQYPSWPVAFHASMGSREVSAVLNAGTDKEAGHADFYGHLAVKPSSEVVQWLKAAAQPMKHDALADFMEEAPGIVRPGRADLLGLLKEFRSTDSGECTTKFDARTGTHAVQFAGGTAYTELPELEVRLPAFENEPEGVSLTVRIRPKKDGSTVVFSLRIQEVEARLKVAWQALLGRLQEGLTEPQRERFYIVP